MWVVYCTRSVLYGTGSDACGVEVVPGPGGHGVSLALDGAHVNKELVASDDVCDAVDFVADAGKTV